MRLFLKASAIPGHDNTDNTAQCGKMQREKLVYISLTRTSSVFELFYRGLLLEQRLAHVVPSVKAFKSILDCLGNIVLGFAFQTKVIRLL